METSRKFRIVPFSRRDGFNVAWRFIVVDGLGHTVEQFDSKEEAIQFASDQGATYIVEPFS